MPHNYSSAEELNAEMRGAVMPVTVLVGVEVVAAFLGNLVVLYVFLFRYSSCNFRFFVLCLTAIDITCSLTTMPGEIVTQLYWYVYPVPIVCKIKSFFNVFTVSSEAFCFLTIAVDRYRKVCHPHNWQISLRVAKWLCLGIYTVGFVIALPVAFYWGTHDETEPGNITTTVCEKDQEYVDTNKPIQYSISIESVVAMCLVCTFLIYILIARTVIFQRRMQRNHEAATKEGRITITASRDEQHPDVRVSAASDTETTYGTLDRRAFNSRVRRKTLIMFILTITFIVTTVIYLTLLSLIAHGILTDLTDGQRALYFFFFRLYFINHVINPIVYGGLDPQFQRIMREMFRRKPQSVRL